MSFTGRTTPAGKTPPFAAGAATPLTELPWDDNLPREADGFWMYGVNPGGMAARGDHPDAAQAAFRTTFSTILKDLADESSGFEEFRASVRAFFEETNSGYEPDWYAAVQAVRKTEVGAEGMPTAPADSPREIRVEMKQIVKVKAEDNIGDTQLARAA